MQEWLKTSLILCTFGFFREMRPSEPFVSEFLSSTQWRNITEEQLNRDIYPIGTYSYLALLILVFLVTDILRYKLIIILSACIGIIIWSLLLWTKSIEALQVVQVLYGTYMAAEVGYYTYIYAKINRDKYQQVTGYTRAAILSGRFSGSVIAQILISYELMNLRELNFITLATQSISLVWSLLLPSVTSSIYFHADTELVEAKYNEPKATKFSFTRAISLLWKHFISAYANLSVIQWSFWWSLSMAGFVQVQVYVQLLWIEIDPNPDRKSYNGGVEAILTLLGALSAILAGYLTSNKIDRYGLWILTSCSLLQGALILYSGFTTTVWTAYMLYILFGALYMFMITIASAKVAKNLEDDSFALIFGINTFLALVFQSLLTVIFISESGFALSTRGQFQAYGGYFLCLGVIFLLTAIIHRFKSK